MHDDIYEIRVVCVGALNLPGLSVVQGNHWFEWLRVPLTVVVVRNVARTILFDTGLADAEGYDALVKGTLGSEGGLDPAVSTDLRAALALAGCNLDEVDVVVPTHLHRDHASNLPNLPHARLALTAAAWRAVESAESRGWLSPASYMPETLAAVRAALREGRATLHAAGEIWPGIWGEHVGGHSRCSQLFGVRTAKGVVMLPADNVGRYETLEHRRPPTIMHDLDAWFRVIERVESEAALYVPSHDFAVFDRFPDGKVA